MGSLIDIKQVLTQIVGFLIFLFLIRKYAWGPVLQTLEDRKAKIAGDLADAERKKQEAAELRAKLEQELRGIDQQARQKIQEAMAEGQRIASDIKSDAQAQARARLDRAEAEIEGERDGTIGPSPRKSRGPQSRCRRPSAGRTRGTYPILMGWSAASRSSSSRESRPTPSNARCLRAGRSTS